MFQFYLLFKSIVVDLIVVIVNYEVYFLEQDIQIIYVGKNLLVLDLSKVLLKCYLVFGSVVNVVGKLCGGDLVILGI